MWPLGCRSSANTTVVRRKGFIFCDGKNDVTLAQALERNFDEPDLHANWYTYKHELIPGQRHAT